MQSIKDAATDFLGHKRIAVTGVSRVPGSNGSNVVYRRLRERGYDVFAVNPNADEVEGDHAYRDPCSIPGGVREHGITVIDGGCPCMFGPTADLGHKVMRVLFALTQKVPKQV